MVDPKGNQASSPWKMSFSGWKDVLLRTWSEQAEDNVSLAAAGVAFYGFLALVPMLGAVVLTYGIAADPQTVLHNMQSLTSVLPKDVAQLIGDQLMGVVQTSGSKKGIGLFIALAVALWGARNAATSVITGVNIAYEEKETRGTVRVNLLALGITAGGVVMAVLALLAITALGYLQKMLPHLPDALAILGKVVSYVVLVLGAAAAAATLYRFAPSRHEAKWEWITPGSMLSAMLWLLLTLGFGFYVAHFGNYNKTYGTLATVVILVTWMYLSAYVFLLGAELNSELEKLTSRPTAEPGSKPVGASTAQPEGPEKPLSDEPSKPREIEGKPILQPADHQHGYLVARATNRIASLVGMRKVGMISAVLSTIGLSLLRKRGRAGAGAALVVSAVGLSLLKRED